MDLVWYPGGSNASYSGQTFQIDTDISGYSIKNFTYNAANSKVRLILDYSMSISGNFTRSGAGNNSNRSFSINGQDLSIGGNVVNTGGVSATLNFGYNGNTLNKLDITGNIGTNLSTGSNSNLAFNVLKGANIGGILYMTQATATSTVILNAQNSNSARSVRVGALATSSTVGSKSIYGAVNANGRSYLPLTGNSADQTWNGNLSNSAAGTGSLHVIMAAGNANKGFTQTIMGTANYKGDTVLTQGKLKFNSETTDIGRVYLGYDTTRGTDANGAADIVTGYTTLSGAETSIIFDGAGAKITRLDWSSGVLGMDLDGVGAGDKVLAIGGVINFNSASDKFLFDFQNIDANTTYTLLSLQGVLIDGQAIDITDEAVRNAILAKLDSNEGQGFAFDLATGTLTFQAGIYIPEPATYAAIFGAMALAFAAYRKRK